MDMEARDCRWEGQPAKALWLDGRHVGLVSNPAVGAELAIHWNSRHDLMVALNWLRAIKAHSLQHHGDEDKSALLHALLVEIPGAVDEALAKAEGRAS
jgi:hypothetical protein